MKIINKFLNLLREPNVVEFRNDSGAGFIYNNTEYLHHSLLQHTESALYRFSRIQKISLLIIASSILFLLLKNWHLSVIILIALLTALYFTDLLFNLILIVRGYSKNPEIKITDAAISAIDEKDLPIYTILCPLYKEWKVIPQFISAIKELDYPKDKLQVLLLLEEDDTESIEKAKEMDLPFYIETVVVPHSLPKTKPKACNYGLLMAKGQYVVIYDAEDVPDALQLKKAVLAFKTVSRKIICMQAKLNFYNPNQNLLTRMFTAEYSLWFELMLTGLQTINAPIPLGGTSNHFKTKLLREVRGWDAFNVTEDCDLGMRISRNGYRTAVLDSITLEEANSDLKNWFTQRTRWIKGYIQTYFVHTRNPRYAFNKTNFMDTLAFQMTVGGKVSSMIINPIMWTLTISYFLFRHYIGSFIESFFPAPVFYMAIASLILGNFLYVYYYMIGCYKHHHENLIKFTFLVPFYWLLMSVASLLAIVEFAYKPHYWAKTIHGLHLVQHKPKKRFVRRKHVKRYVNDSPIYQPSY